MAWTYDQTLLATSTTMQVRFLIGDTDSRDQLVMDEEIEFQLTLQGSVSGAAVACCEFLSAKFARTPDHSLGPYSVKASQKAEQFAKLAIRISKTAAKYTVPSLPSSQHTTIFDIDMMNYDTDDHREDDI